MTQKQRAALEGAEVRFYHLRYAEGSQVLASARTIRQHGRTISPRGGLTRCIIEWPDGNVSSTEARCCPRDNFNKSIGRLICVNRAFKLREWAMSGEAA